MPQCQFLFSAVFGFRKVTQEIFSELDETNCEVPIFTRRRRSPKESRRGATGWPHHACERPALGPRLGVVWAPLASTSLALPGIYSPSRENPGHPSTIPRKVPSRPSSPTLVWEGPEALPGTLPEGDHHRRHLHHHACLRSDA